MFKVKEIETGDIYTVYDLQVDDDGGVCFLIYCKYGWWYEDCNKFEPIDA